MRGSSGVASDNWQDSSQRQLARASRGGVRGPSSPVYPATFAGRPVRGICVSRSLGPRFDTDAVSARVEWQ
jgi:hypothetical protein